MIERIETVVVGAGQAGLALSHFLSQAGHEHIVLEKSAQVADAWRNRRWDSFTLVTPNWSFRLPGAEYADGEPHGFMPRAEIIRRFEAYARAGRLPVLYSTEVTRVERMQDHFRYRTVTPNKTFESTHVVIATGLYQKVKVPPYAAHLPPDIQSLASDAYRNPQALRPGAVLVIGSGQSGCQIAEELHAAGRRVYLSTGSSGRVPRRYRGLDGFDWLNRIGFFDRTLDMLASPKERFFSPPHLSGKDGGHAINLHQFSRDGITLLGHALGLEEGKFLFAPDLKANLAQADAFAANAIRQFDAYARQNGLDLPTEEVPMLDDGFRAPVRRSLNLARAGIGAVIWATGYSSDYTLVRLPILDAYGYPSADLGVTRFPGLYLLGMNWMNTLKTGFLLGVGEVAQHLADVITSGH